MSPLSWARWQLLVDVEKRTLKMTETKSTPTLIIKTQESCFINDDALQRGQYHPSRMQAINKLIFGPTQEGKSRQKRERGSRIKDSQSSKHRWSSQISILIDDCNWIFYLLIKVITHSLDRLSLPFHSIPFQRFNLTSPNLPILQSEWNKFNLNYDPNRDLWIEKSVR